MFLAMLFPLSAWATDGLVYLDTRPGVKITVFYLKSDIATATVVLLPGGKGSFGRMVGGQPSSKNFLVRSHEYFAEAGLNVAIMGRSSDKNDLGYSDRISVEHMQDIKVLVEYLKNDTDLPVWLIGTSKGTVSATAAAISFGNENLAGLVLTSSVVSYKKTGAVPYQDLEKIKIPVLILHHEKDRCKSCDPSEVPAISKGLKNAPIKKEIFVSGGGVPSGRSCGSLHYHGFIGKEKIAVNLITDWLKKTSP